MSFKVLIERAEGTANREHRSFEACFIVCYDLLHKVPKKKSYSQVRITQLYEIVSLLYEITEKQ